MAESARDDGDVVADEAEDAVAEDSNGEKDETPIAAVDAGADEATTAPTLRLLPFSQQGRLHPRCVAELIATTGTGGDASARRECCVHRWMVSTHTRTVLQTAWAFRRSYGHSVRSVTSRPSMREQHGFRCDCVSRYGPMAADVGVYCVCSAHRSA